MKEHTQATPKGHLKANDTTDRENTLGELNAKLHTQQLNVYGKKIAGKKQDINERHYTEHLHKTNTTTIERIHYHNRFTTFDSFF